MQFKDLPSYEEIEKTFNKLYDYHGTYQIILINQDNYVTTYFKLHEAYYYLAHNPELEVRDDFFGNNFPFLYGWVHKFLFQEEIVQSPVILDLKVFKEMSNSVLSESNDVKFIDDYSMIDFNSTELHSLIKAFHEKTEYVSRFKGCHFITPTYDNLVKRIEIAKVMCS